MDSSLITAIALATSTSAYVIAKAVEAYTELNNIKNKKAKITIENYSGRKYIIKTNSDDPKELKRSVENLLQH